MDTTRECKRCSGSIYGRTKRAIFCSYECKEQWHLDAAKTSAKERRAGRRCAVCKEPFDSPSGKALCCSTACSVRHQNERKQRLRRERWEASDPRCKGCDVALSSYRIGVAFCSPRCKSRVHGAKWRERAPGYMRQYLYGVTPEQFAQMVSDQDGLCAMCYTEMSSDRNGFHVDHDHATGKVRGLLCQRCNLTLGHAKDDTVWLRAAIAYLERPAS